MPTGRGDRDRDRGGFQYRERSTDVVRRRANQSGGAFDSLFRSDVDSLSIKAGDWLLRICPPTWNDRILDELGLVHPVRSDDWDPENADNFGLEIFVHFGVGGDNQKYLCPKKMKGEPCAVCEEREEAFARGAEALEMTQKQFEEYTRSLQPTKRVLAYAIDREDQKAGPLLWNMAWSMDRDLNKLSIDKVSQEAICIDHPVEGYDIEFTVTGTGIKTQYSGIAIARRSTPLSDNRDRMADWLEFVAQNPIPELLVFFDYDHMKAALVTQKRGRDEDEPRSRSRERSTRDEDEDDNRGRRSRRDEEPEDDAPPPRSRRSRDEEDDVPPPSDRGRHSRDEEPEDDAPPPRSRRSRDEEPEDDAPPPRTSLTAARSRDEAVDPEPAEERPTRRRMGGNSDNSDAPESTPPARSRTRDEEPPARERRSLRDRVAEGRNRSSE